MEVAEANPTLGGGFLDECWWSRVALPTLSSFSEEGKPLRLIQQSVAKGRPRAESHLLLRTLPAPDRRHVAEVRGRKAHQFHNDAVPFVVLREARRAGQEGFASHLGQRQLARLQRGQALARKHNREVKKSGCGVRIVSCLLPKQSPWLNAIEPKWVHGKRKVVELDGLLGAYELADRVCGASIVRITSISPFPRRSLDHNRVCRG